MGNHASYISKKQSWLRFAVSFVLAGGAAALLCLFLAGPRLGKLYDFLLRQRPVLPIAGELLIIDTIPYSDISAFDMPDNILEPSAVASLIMTLSEFDASTLILQAPVLGLSAGSSVREEEIRYRFDREFGVINRNIRNLFDAIRTGSIAPWESGRYVGELVELSESGKDRLIAALISRDEEGIRRLEQAAAVFGNVRRPGDLLVQVIRAGDSFGEGGRPGALADQSEYSRARPDRDGVLRRIAPLGFAVDREGRALEHIIYSALKNRYLSSGIAETDTGYFLVLEDSRGRQSIPLDYGGALLFEIPRRNQDFRRVRMADFLEYDEADQSLRLLMEEMEIQGIYSLIQGEENPFYLYDYALALREDLLTDPGGAKKTAWRRARENYFTSLEHFLYGPSEMNLVTDLEIMISARDSGDEVPVRVIRDSLIKSFAELRSKYHEVLELRTRLESNLAGSFCILGPCPDLSVSMSDTGVSALLANSIIIGRAITPGEDLFLFFGALAAALLTALVLRSKAAANGLGYGIFLTFLTGSGFSMSFVISGIWLNPWVPVIAAGMVTLVSFFWALVFRLSYSRQFRSCYGPFIAASGLKHLILSGVPKPKDLISVKAAVVAIRNPDLFLQENRDNSKTSAAAILDFREKLGRAVKKADAMVAGNGGDLVLACFGSPLERVIFTAQNPEPAIMDIPAIRAAAFISELLRHKETAALRFGMDTGLCTFTWSPVSGYSVFGKPVNMARILSEQAHRKNVRVLISDSVNTALPESAVKTRGSFRKPDGSAGESFYELLL